VLLLDERIRADGSLAKCWARVAGDRLHLTDDDGTEGELSLTAVDRVMVRYGRALDPTISFGPRGADVLELAGGFRLRRIRYHAVVDTEARDYLVWERPGDEPRCVVATMATAALRYLVLRLGAERPQESET